MSIAAGLLDGGLFKSTVRRAVQRELGARAGADALLLHGAFLRFGFLVLVQ